MAEQDGRPTETAPEAPKNPAAGEVQARLREAARAKLADLLRQERGVGDAPTSQAPVSQPVSQPVTAPAGAGKDVTQVLAELQAELAALKSAPQETYTKAAAERAEAERLNAEAIRKQQEIVEASKNPLDFIQKLGYTPDEWQAMLMAGGKPDPTVERVKAAEKAAQEALSELKKYQREQTRTAILRDEIAPAMKDAPLVAKMLKPEDVLTLVENHYRDVGVVLTPAEAVKILNERYTKQFSELLSDAEIAKILNTSAVSSAAMAPPADKRPQTLTNSLTSTTNSTQKGPLSLDERRAAASLIIKQMLNRG